MASSARNELRCRTCGVPVAEVTIDDLAPGAPDSSVAGPAPARSRPKYFPFCSVRCQLADLGKWLDEEYRFEGPPADPESLDRSKD